MRILFAEDDKRLSKMIDFLLKKENYIVDCVYNGQDAIDYANLSDYDIIILDWMMPLKSGIEVCRYLRAKNNQTAILMLTARDSLEDKIDGLDSGADDYLAKPYEPRELVLRIEHILKRNISSKITISDFEIDKENRIVVLDNYSIEFTKIEFEIFIFLIENLNKISSREQILNATSLDVNTKNRTIDMHISNIRCKIEDDSKNPKYIKSVWGIGYKFVG